MPYDFVTLQNMITTDLRENLKVSPHEVADIIEYLANLVEGGESVKEYGGVLTPSSSDPATSGHKMFAVAGESGTYSNLIGNPVVKGNVAFLTFNGTEWDVIEFFNTTNKEFTFTNSNVINVPHNLYKNVNFLVEKYDPASNEYEPVVHDRVIRRNNDMDIYIQPRLSGRVLIY